MKKIVAINCSPRTTWNTAALVREAAKGAQEQGAEVEVFDLYKLACMIPEIRLQTGDVISRRGLLEQFGIHIRTANAGSVAQCVWKAAIDEVKAFPGTDASVENDAIVRNLEKEQENLICDFQDYVNDCIQNPAPFCAMRNKLCVDKYGACKRGSSACSGFVPRVRRDGDE